LVEAAADDARLPGFRLEPDGIGVAPRRVVDAGEETPELPRRQGAAPVDLTRVLLSLLPGAQARSKIGPHPFLGLELEPDAPVGAGLPGEETPDIAPAVPFVVERRLGKPAGPDEPDARGQGEAVRCVLAGAGDVSPPLLGKKTVVPARHQLRTALEGHPVGRLDRKSAV